jgi:hypothetical protein
MHKPEFKYIPFHILFFSAFPSLALLANNLEQADTSNILRPLGLSLLITIIAYLIVQRLGKDSRKAGLFITWCLVLFFSYGHIYELIKGDLLFGAIIGRHRFLLGLWLVLFAMGAYCVNRRTGPVKEVTVILNGIGFMLLFLQIVQISIYEIRSGISSRQAQSAASVTFLSPDDPNELPDVYLIILDMYGREDALMAHYNYDNHEFVSQLEALDFYVAKCGRSNYSKTILSLPSQLNMEYIADILDDPNHEKLEFLLQNSSVQRALEEIGYKSIAFDTGAGWANLDNSDVFIDRPPEMLGRGLEDFEELFLKTTLARPLLDYAELLDRAGFHFFETAVEMKAQRIQMVLDHLRLLPETEGAKFVYAHIIAPHPPHVFNRDGSVNLNAEMVDGQVGLPIQLDYLNPQILEIVKNIILQSEVDPIIIIEGDHGFADLQRTSILLAMYLPGDGQKHLYPHVSLVNTFRIIFNSYFGTNLTLLTDQSYKMLNDISLDYAPHPEWNPDCMP